MGDKLRIDKNDQEEYEPTESEDNYSDDEKELLTEIRKGRAKRDVDTKNELLAFEDTDDAAEDEVMDELIGESDIEGAENDDDIPDEKDWGNKSRYYYNTDFVDQDYSTYNEQEEEMAKQEEEEVKIIQMRLAKQMNEEDFLVDDDGEVTPDDRKAETDSKNSSTKLKADISGLTKREKQRLFQKDSPEFSGLITDFNDYLDEIDDLIAPVLEYVEQNNVPIIPALRFAQLYQNIVLTYCSNVSFYLLLKAKRLSVRNHPLTKRLVQLKKLLSQLKDKHVSIIKPQLEALMERITDGDKFTVLPINRKTVTKRVEGSKTMKKCRLAILDQWSSVKQEDETIHQSDLDGNTSNEDYDKEPEDKQNDEEIIDENLRRGITYQIAKNKGLMPTRKKEQRNPRVKHRNKFRKALIRRKGAVRTVRHENKRYGGEISGIKTTVSKSIKFKS